MSELRLVKLSEMNAIKLGLRNDELYFRSEVDKVIAELNAEARKATRALWIQRAKTACLEFKLFVKDSVHAIDSTGADHAERMAIKWKTIERKCRAKAEEYK